MAKYLNDDGAVHRAIFDASKFASPENKSSMFRRQFLDNVKLSF
jgi:hypothetical protein